MQSDKTEDALLAKRPFEICEGFNEKTMRNCLFRIRYS